MLCDQAVPRGGSGGHELRPAEPQLANRACPAAAPPAAHRITRPPRRVDLPTAGEPAALTCPMVPPAARPGAQATPLLGRVLAGLATLRGPLEQALRCREQYGDVFTLDLPGNAPITYLLGQRGYAFMNNLPVKLAGIGSVLQLVSVFGNWITRADPSPEYLELLALGGRSYLQRRLLRPERVAASLPIVESIAAARTAGWTGRPESPERVDLSSAVISLVHSTSIRCVAGEKLWRELHQDALPLLRQMAAGVDVPRLPLGATPARFALPEYWAAKAFERRLRRYIAEHLPSSGEFDLLDDLREHMVVDGRPLDPRDLAWALNYVLFNACAYPGTYAFWSLLDLVSDATVLAGVRDAAPEAAVRHAEHAILETIRLNPVTVAGRTLKQDVYFVDDQDPEPRTWKIPAHHLIGSAPGSFTRDPAVHAAPDRYCPHRFARGEPVPKLFGGGAFGCVAQGYVRTILPALHTWLLRRFDFALEGPLPARRARPALHYPHAAVWARVSRRV